MIGRVISTSYEYVHTPYISKIVKQRLRAATIDRSRELNICTHIRYLIVANDIPSACRLSRTREVDGVRGLIAGALSLGPIDDPLACSYVSTAGIKAEE